MGKLEESAINAERDVIMREMEEVGKMQEEVIFDHLHDTAFQGTGLGRTILGPAENVMSLTREDLRNYIDTHYTAPRMVVAAAGAVDHNELVDVVEKSFGNLPTQPKDGLVVPEDPVRFTGSDIRLREDSMDVAHVALAVQSDGWT